MILAQSAQLVQPVLKALKAQKVIQDQRVLLEQQAHRFLLVLQAQRATHVPGALLERRALKAHRV